MKKSIIFLLITGLIIIIAVFLLKLIIFQQKGGADFVPVYPIPNEVKDGSQEYLYDKLGKEYTDNYIIIKDVVYSKYFNAYDIRFKYNFPYDTYYSNRKEFTLRFPKDGLCCTGNIPSKPYKFNINEEEAIDIAKGIGIKGNPKVGFSFFGGIVVEHNPLNPESKNLLSLQDYAIIVYNREEIAGEIAKVFLNPDTGEIIGYYIAPTNYAPGDVVSVGGIQN